MIMFHVEHYLMAIFVGAMGRPCQVPIIRILVILSRLYRGLGCHSERRRAAKQARLWVAGVEKRGTF